MSLKQLPLQERQYECIIAKSLKKEYTTINVAQNKLNIDGDNFKQQEIEIKDCIPQILPNNGLQLTKKVSIQLMSEIFDTRLQLLMEILYQKHLNSGTLKNDALNIEIIINYQIAHFTIFNTTIPIIILNNKQYMLRLDSFQKIVTDEDKMIALFCVDDTVFSTFQFTKHDDFQKFYEVFQKLSITYNSIIQITQIQSIIKQKPMLEYVIDISKSNIKDWDNECQESYYSNVIIYQEYEIQFAKSDDSTMFSQLYLLQKNNLFGDLVIDSKTNTLQLYLKQLQDSQPTQLFLINFNNISSIIQSDFNMKNQPLDHSTNGITSSSQNALKSTFTSDIQDEINFGNSKQEEEETQQQQSVQENVVIILQLINGVKYALSFPNQARRDTFVHNLITCGYINHSPIQYQLFFEAANTIINNHRLPVNHQILYNMILYIKQLTDLQVIQHMIQKIVVNFQGVYLHLDKLDGKQKTDILFLCLHTLKSLLTQQEITTIQVEYRLNFINILSFLKMLLSEKYVYKDQLPQHAEQIIQGLKTILAQYYNDNEMQILILSILRMVLSFTEFWQSPIAINGQQFINQNTEPINMKLKMYQFNYMAKGISDFNVYTYNIDFLQKDQIKHALTDQNQVKIVINQSLLLQTICQMIQSMCKYSIQFNERIIVQSVVLGILQDCLSLKRDSSLNISESSQNSKISQTKYFYQTLLTICQKYLYDELIYFSCQDIRSIRIASQSILQTIVNSNVIQELLITCSITHYILYMCQEDEVEQLQTCTLLAKCYYLDQNIQQLFSRLFSPGLIELLTVKENNKDKILNNEIPYPFSTDTVHFQKFLEKLHTKTYSITLVWDQLMLSELKKQLQNYIDVFKKCKQEYIRIAWNYDECSVNLIGISDNKYNNYDFYVGEYVLSSLIGCQIDGIGHQISYDNTKTLTQRYQQSRYQILRTITKNVLQQKEYEKLISKKQNQQSDYLQPNDNQQTIVKFKSSPGKLLIANLQNQNIQTLIDQLFNKYYEYNASLHQKCGTLYVLTMLGYLFDGQYQFLDHIYNNIVISIKNKNHIELYYQLKFLEIIGFQINTKDISKRCYWTFISKSSIIFPLCYEILPLLLLQLGALSPTTPIQPQLNLYEDECYGRLFITILNILICCTKYTPSVDATGSILVPVPKLYQILQAHVTIQNLLSLLVVCSVQFNNQSQLQSDQQMPIIEMYEQIYMKTIILFQKLLKQQPQMESYLASYGFCELVLNNNFSAETNIQIFKTLHIMANLEKSQSLSIIQDILPVQLFSLLKKSRQSALLAATIFSKQSYITVSCIWLKEMKQYLNKQLNEYITRAANAIKSVQQIPQNQYFDIYIEYDRFPAIFNLPVVENHPVINERLQSFVQIEQQYKYGFYINLFDINVYLYIYLQQHQDNTLSYDEIQQIYTQMIQQTEQQFTMQDALQKIGEIMEIKPLSLQNIRQLINKQDIVDVSYIQLLTFLLQICIKHLNKMLATITQLKVQEDDNAQLNIKIDQIMHLKQRRWQLMNQMFLFLGLLCVFVKVCKEKLENVKSLEQNDINGVIKFLALAHQTDAQVSLNTTLNASNDYIGSEEDEIQQIKTLMNDYSEVLSHTHKKISNLSTMCLNSVMTEQMSYVKYVNIMQILQYQEHQLNQQNYTQLYEDRFIQNIDMLLQYVCQQQSPLEQQRIKQEEFNPVSAYINITYQSCFILQKIINFDHSKLEMYRFPLYIIKFYFQSNKLCGNMLKILLMKSQVYQDIMNIISPYILQMFQNSVTFKIDEDVQQPTFIYNTDVKQYIISYLDAAINQSTFNESVIEVNNVFSKFDINKNCLADILYIKPYYVPGIIEALDNLKSIIDIEQFKANLQDFFQKVFMIIYKSNDYEAIMSNAQYLSYISQIPKEYKDLLEVCETLIILLSIRKEMRPEVIKLLRVLAGSYCEAGQGSNVCALSQYILISINVDNADIFTYVLQTFVVNYMSTQEGFLDIKYDIIMLFYIQINNADLIDVKLLNIYQVILMHHILELCTAEDFSKQYEDNKQQFVMIMQQLQLCLTNNKSFIIKLLPVEILQQIILSDYQALRSYFVDVTATELNTFVWNQQISDEVQSFINEQYKQIHEHRFQLHNLNINFEDVSLQTSIKEIYDKYHSTNQCLADGCYILDNTLCVDKIRDVFNVLDELISSIYNNLQYINDESLNKEDILLAVHQQLKYLVQITQTYLELCQYQLANEKLQYIICVLLFQNPFKDLQQLETSMDLLTYYQQYDINILHQYNQHFVAQLFNQDQNTASLYSLLQATNAKSEIVEQYHIFAAAMLYKMSQLIQIQYCDQLVSQEYQSQLNFSLNVKFLLHCTINNQNKYFNTVFENISIEEFKLNQYQNQANGIAIDPSEIISTIIGYTPQQILESSKANANSLQVFIDRKQKCFFRKEDVIQQTAILSVQKQKENKQEIEYNQQKLIQHVKTIVNKPCKWNKLVFDQEIVE